MPDRERWTVTTVTIDSLLTQSLPLVPILNSEYYTLYRRVYVKGTRRRNYTFSKLISGFANWFLLVRSRLRRSLSLAWRASYGPIALAQSTSGKSREKCDPHFGSCYALNWSLTSQLRQATSQPRLLQGFSLETGRGSQFLMEKLWWRGWQEFIGSS